MDGFSDDEFDDSAAGNLAALLSQVFTCQHCGQSFLWNAIHDHERNRCSKRPQGSLSTAAALRQSVTHPGVGYRDASRSNPFGGETHLEEDLNGNDCYRKIPLPRFDNIADGALGSGDVRVRPSATKPAGTPNMRQIFSTYHKRSDVPAAAVGFGRARTAEAVSDGVKEQSSGRVSSSATGKGDDLRGTATCVYCGRQFGENKYAHRLMHQRICESNPRSRTWCIFCSMEFKSTVDVLAVEQAATHEEVCKKNPTTICKFCGLKCGGHMGESKREVQRRLESHYSVCQANPMNVAECRFCYRRFSSSSYGPAYVLCDAHQDQCGSNPRNKCRYCGLTFCAPMNALPAESATAQRRAHEYGCHMQFNASGCGYAEHLYGGAVDFDFDRLFNQRQPSVAGAQPPSSRLRGSTQAGGGRHMDSGAKSPPSGTAGGGQSAPQLPLTRDLRTLAAADENCRALLKSVERQLRGLEPARLRRRLRQLQLQFHPDKNVDAPQKERETAEVVFQYVQGVWDRQFRRAQA